MWGLLTAHAYVQWIQTGCVNLDDDLVGEVDTRRGVVFREGQHIIWTVPVDYPCAHGRAVAPCG